MINIAKKMIQNNKEEHENVLKMLKQFHSDYEEETPAMIYQEGYINALKHVLEILDRSE